MFKKKKIEVNKAKMKHWCMECFYDDVYTTATHYMYNYADGHTVPLCKNHFIVEVNAPIMINFDMN